MTDDAVVAVVIGAMMVGWVITGTATIRPEQALARSTAWAGDHDAEVMLMPKEVDVRRQQGRTIEYGREEMRCPDVQKQ